MRLLLSTLAAGSLLALAACGDDASQETATPPAANPPVTTAPAVPDAPAAPAPETRTQTEMREAGEAIEDAARATGDAAGSAMQDLRDASGPALERAQEEGARALDAARDGLNNLTRGAACETARAANDAEGIAANC